MTFGADPVEWAARVNESGAQTVREHPGRFGLFASLPLPDADAARATSSSTRWTSWTPTGSCC